MSQWTTTTTKQVWFFKTLVCRKTTWFTRGRRARPTSAARPSAWSRRGRCCGSGRRSGAGAGVRTASWPWLRIWTGSPPRQSSRAGAGADPRCRPSAAPWGRSGPGRRPLDTEGEARWRLRHCGDPTPYRTVANTVGWTVLFWLDFMSFWFRLTFYLKVSCSVCLLFCFTSCVNLVFTLLWLSSTIPASRVCLELWKEYIDKYRNTCESQNIKDICKWHWSEKWLWTSWNQSFHTCDQNQTLVQYLVDEVT